MDESHTTYIVGKNKEDNWKIYKESNQNYTIFHLDKFSSPYVIVNIPINDLTAAQINNAAQLCKSNSKYKNLPNLGVMYTSISNTKLGTNIGSFVVTSRRKTKVIHL